MPEPNYESEFMQLVLGLQSSGWMLLGKIANPMTGTLEKNLDHAKATIDVLLMLKTKTKGNLTAAESSMLDSAITQLQVNYTFEVENANSEKPVKSEKKEEIKSKKKQ